MKIEVGEYIRTKQGDISKVRYVDEENIFLEDSVWSKNDLYEKTNVLYFDDEEIAKHSKNIIDLIEVGDFVNGKEIHEIDENRKRLYSYEKDDYNIILNRDIQRVVTKEQFSNMEYRL